MKAEIFFVKLVSKNLLRAIENLIVASRKKDIEGLRILMLYSIN